MVLKIANKDEMTKKLAEAGSKLVVVDFYAEWCGPCIRIAPHIVELADQHTDVVFLKVDIDAAEDLTEEYQITSMPTFILFKNGKPLEEFSGANMEKLKSLIQKHK